MDGGDVLWLCTITAVRAASPWPDDAGWVDLGAPDPAGDGADGPELEGALAWQADETTVFVRVGLSADPAGLDRDVGLLLSTDGDPATFEWTILAQGPDHVLVVRENVSGLAGPAVVDLGPARVLGAAATGETRPTSGALDLQLPRATLLELGIDDATTLHAWAVAAVAWPLGWSDVGGCDDRLGCADLAAIAAAAVRIDADGDGLTEPVERGLGTSPSDADSDDDGLSDGDEADDANGDGLTDATQCDRDGDGLSDGLELGVAAPLADTGSGCFVADADPGSTTDPDRADTDGGGLGDHVDTDSDGDGIPDEVERYGDRDGDGVRNARDLDSDGDTLPDAIEYDRFTPDFDGDDRPDYLDTDTDDDGIPDRVEGLDDLDCDGRPDFRDRDPEDGDCDPVPLDPPAVTDPGPAPTLSRDPLPDPGGCSVAPNGVGWLTLAILAGLVRRSGRPEVTP